MKKLIKVLNKEIEYQRLAILDYSKVESELREKSQADPSNEVLFNSWINSVNQIASSTQDLRKLEKVQEFVNKLETPAVEKPKSKRGRPKKNQ